MKRTSGGTLEPHDYLKNGKKYQGCVPVVVLKRTQTGGGGSPTKK